MKKLNKIKFTEVILLILVWLVLISAPVFFRNNDSFYLRDLLNPLQTIIPLFVIFLINRFLLVPKLLLKKRRLFYLISVFGLIAVFTFGSYLFFPLQKDNRPLREMGNQRKPPPHIQRPEHGFPPPPVQPGKRGPVPIYANFLIFAVLMVGFDTGLMNSFRLAKAEKERAKLEKENAESQLAFLRSQVSPHFFMNTLNNIHSLIDIDSDEAKESIIRLSKLMRHLLYDSEIEKIPIQKEIDFIENYVDLMKLRYSNKVKINLQLPAQLPEKSIPPLLFTSYLENAFKHGISYQNSSFIDITFSVSSENLTFEIKNSKVQLEKKEESSGIGIENSRKRLDLIYGDKYNLKIEDMKYEHYLQLTIPL